MIQKWINASGHLDTQLHQIQLLLHQLFLDSFPYSVYFTGYLELLILVTQLTGKSYL